MSVCQAWQCHMEERVLETLAAYQLFHMHRVAELKDVMPSGINHHDAFNVQRATGLHCHKSSAISTFNMQH